MPDPATPVPGDAHEPETVAGRMKLRMGPHEVELHANVPKDEVPLRLVLPLARLLSDAIVAVADAEVAASDERISCTKGCGACCRQLVPVSMPEMCICGRPAAVCIFAPSGRFLQPTES